MKNKKIAIIFFAFIFLFFANINAVGAERDFEKIIQMQTRGGVSVLGNTVLCPKNSDGTCKDVSTRNDDLNLKYITNSKAKLEIPLSQYEIKWAGIFWMSVGQEKSTESAALAAFDDAKSRSITIVDPAGTTHDVSINTGVNIPASTHDTYVKHWYSKYYVNYQSYANITDIVSNAGTGFYTIKNLYSTIGTTQNPDGNYGAWMIAVIYNDIDPNSVKDIRDVAVFNGYRAILDDTEENFTIDGFYTPKAGDVDSKLFIFTAEGDKVFNGDQLLINPRNDGVNTFYNIVYPGGSTSNVFISGISIPSIDTPNVPGSLPRDPKLTYNYAIDLHAMQIGDNPTSTQKYIGNNESGMEVKIKTNNDSFYASTVIVSNEVYKPNICYDYAYKQYTQYFTEDNTNVKAPPFIVGTGLDDDEPVHVELYFQNREDSDVQVKNLKLKIGDLNTTQAIYQRESTYIVKPGHTDSVYVPDLGGADTTDAYNKNIMIDDPNNDYDNFDSLSFFYVDYNITLKTENINMPLNAELSYDLVLTDSTGTETTIPYTTRLGDGLDLCSPDNFAYLPAYRIFNVEDATLANLTGHQKYNIPTQTAGRVGNFDITSYDETNIHTRANTTTIVAIDLIDAGKYHEIDASCLEPDNRLSPRIWVTFDNNTSIVPFNYTTILNAISSDMTSDSILSQSNPISTPGEFFSWARENVAFRISYMTPGEDGELLELDSFTCPRNKGGQGTCYNILNFPDITNLDLGNGHAQCLNYVGPGSTIGSKCGNAGTDHSSALTAAELAVCMECLYGFQTTLSCSRDNFAIRPETFRVDLSDQDQNNTSIRSEITKNDNTDLHHVVAGYDYALDINATNYMNENPTIGYDASFHTSGDSGERTFKLVWTSFSNDTTYCNDIEDQNKSARFFNGKTALDINSTNVGKYTLNLYDKLWTRVDWESSLMGHHQVNSDSQDVRAYFTQGVDCEKRVAYASSVPNESAVTTINGDDLQNVSGCDINSTHVPASGSPNEGQQYTDIPLQVHPYTFDQSAVNPQIGPYTRANGQTFVYMDTPSASEADNTDMSYNLNGTFYAAGYDHGQLSNFVTGCYADDVNMDLNFTYNSPTPTTGPYLNYSIKDIDTVTDTVIRPMEVPPNPTSNLTPTRVQFVRSYKLNATQAKTYFYKDMNGSITMDLGYNFRRDFNRTLNPRYIEFKDFNITDVPYSTGSTGIHADLLKDFKIFGNKNLDQNVTFIYGRAKSSKYFYDDVTSNSINTPISVVAYCIDTEIPYFSCVADGNINSLEYNKTNEYDWYLVLKHQMTPDNDGNITLKATSPDVASSAVSVTSPVVINNTNGVDQNVQVATTATSRPVLVNIDFDTGTNKWLIYNEFNNSVPSPFYKVRFIGTSDWAGHGDTGNVVDSNASMKKNRRLGW